MAPRKNSKKTTSEIAEVLKLQLVTPTNEDKIVLTMDAVNQDDKKYDEMIRVYMPSGKYTEIYKYFRPSKIEELLLDMGGFFGDFEKHGGSIKQEDMEKHMMLYIIKHFSSVCPEFPVTFEEKLMFFGKLIDHEVVNEIQDKFDPNEIFKVFDVAVKKLDAVQKLGKENVEFKNKLMSRIDGLENADAIKAAMFGEMGDESKDGDSE